MKRILFIACLSMLFCAGCQKDDADISSDPADLVGKWKEVKWFDGWKDNGRWYTETDWEDSAEDTIIYYWIFNEDGTYERGHESKSTGEIVERTRRGTWSYSDKTIMCNHLDEDDYYGEVRKLTSSELEIHFPDVPDIEEEYDYESYEGVILKRVK